jgi:Flp pilus assembly protein TadG
MMDRRASAKIGAKISAKTGVSTMKRTVIRAASTLLRPFRGLMDRARRDDRGVAAVELALTSPVLIVMMVAVVDLGLATYASMQVYSAAYAGGHYAILHGYDATKITNAALSATSYPGLSATPAPTKSCGCPSTDGITSAACGTTCVSGDPVGTYVTVSVQATHNTLFPYPMIPSSYTFATKSTVRIP